VWGISWVVEGGRPPHPPPFPLALGLDGSIEV